MRRYQSLACAHSPSRSPAVLPGRAARPLRSHRRQTRLCAARRRRCAPSLPPAGHLRHGAAPFLWRRLAAHPCWRPNHVGRLGRVDQRERPGGRRAAGDSMSALEARGGGSLLARRAQRAAASTKPLAQAHPTESPPPCHSLPVKSLVLFPPPTTTPHHTHTHTAQDSTITPTFPAYRLAWTGW